METNPSIFLRADSIPLCTKCNEYLSVGPVKTLSGKPVCGRCQEAKAVPADFYEKLAQHMYFPCTNDRYGCKATLAWGSVLAHEKKCKFSPAICPALNCSQKIQKEKIIEHFESNHEKLMLAAKNNFILPCSYEDQNAPVNKILTWKKQVFVLKMNFSSTCCFLGILSWESSDTKKLLYNLSIEDDKKRQSMHIRDVSIVEYQMKHHDNSAMTKLDVAALKSALNADTLLCTISIGQKSSKEYSLNESLLTELECPICMEYMKPPIWMCSMGHSICNSCKPNVMKCPTCQVALKRNRNFALEKVIEHIGFPCKFKDLGCCFSGSLTHVTLHENTCSHGGKRGINCFVNYIEKCSWSGNLSEMISHLSQTHPNYFFDYNSSIVLDLREFKELISFMEYNTHIFKIHILNKKPIGLQFSVKLVRTPTTEKPKYQFHMNFRDLNENNRILKLNGNCVISQYHDTILNLKNSIIIHNQLMKDFVRGHEIEFEIDIVEC